MQYSVYPAPEVTEKSTQIELHRAFDELQCISESPWLLKVDVEGAELAVLKSIEHLLEYICIIYLEYHSEQERLADGGLYVVEKLGQDCPSRQRSLCRQTAYDRSERPFRAGN
jgi:hypothetical protein